MSLIEKYDRLADGFSEREYAAPSAYAERCAAVIVACAPVLVAGASVLDLACGDGLMAAALAARGLRYHGVDASERMVAAARSRYPELSFATARIEEFEPREPVDATICLRAFFYPEDRVAFFRRVASYTRGPFIFDFRRPEFPDHGAIVADLRAAGFSRIGLRPFFLPQLRALPAAATWPLFAIERSGPLAWLLTRRVGRLFCVASA